MSRCTRSLFTGLIPVAAFGCLTDDTPSGPTAGGKVVVLTESAAAATEIIGPAGGTIQATGSNGITYALEIPENALLRDTAITLTPAHVRNAWRTVHGPERLLATQHHVLG